MKNILHPWHGASHQIEEPYLINGIIEISRGSRAKYEVDKPSGLLRLDRVLYGAMFYPTNYGFIPQSLGGDKDPLDILVISQVAIEPLAMVRAKVIGVMQMVDSGEADDKIIAVAVNDMAVNHWNNIEELPAHALLELRNFFEEYKKLENKTVSVDDFQGKEAAWKIVLESLEFYKTIFGKQD